MDFQERSAFDWFHGQLEDALQIAKSHSVLIAGAEDLSGIERAVVSIAPSSLSIASSILLLVSEGFTPSARILVRPLLERTATLDYLVNEEGGLKLWESGWKKQNARPSLSYLLSRMDFGRTNPQLIQEFIINDLNAVLHVDPEGLDSLMSPVDAGQRVHWFERHPSDFSRADNVCHASAMCAVFIGSNIRRAFRERLKRWTPPDAAESEF